MLNPARWVVMLIGIAVITVAGIHDHNWLLAIVGIVLTILTLIGMTLDYFRDREIRTLKEEIAGHRRLETYHRRRASNERLHP